MSPSHDGSFELLEMNTILQECRPEAFVEVGKVVSKSCIGILPLAVVIAGLLWKY